MKSKYLVLLLIVLASCKTNQGNEAPQVNETPTNPPEVFDVKVDSLTCKWSVKIGDYGVKSDCAQIISKGSAQGPVGARVELPLLSWSTDKFDCGNWTLKTGALITVGSTCVRQEGQQETTSWSVVAEGCPLKNYYDNDRSHIVKIYKDDDIQPQKQDSKSAGCE